MRQRRHYGQHGDGCFGCKVQSVQLSPQATPTRRNNIPPAPSRHNGWERGVLIERRPGGFEMPVLNSKGHPIGLKDYQDNRRRIDEARKRVREQGAAAFAGGKRG